MLIARRRQLGVTLIELMIGIAVLAVLATLAMPMFQQWMANTQIRNASDALLNGLQLARTEALRRNKNVEFRLGNASDWEVWQAQPALKVQGRGSQEGQSNLAVVAPTPGDASTVTFSPLGGVVSNLDGSSTLTQLDVQAASGSPTGVRNLRVVVPASGGVRMCDPGSDLKSDDTRRC
jgi:type IV fimbrial biogenesis protein FimT